MPFKDPEKRRLYRRKWYKINRESEKNHVRRRKLEIRRWFWKLKKSLKCSLCSEKHPSIIDFHHKNGVKKEKDIAFMVSNGYSIKEIENEISKCQILCSNCHRKLHYRLKGNNF